MILDAKRLSLALRVAGYSALNGEPAERLGADDLVRAGSLLDLLATMHDFSIPQIVELLMQMAERAIERDEQLSIIFAPPKGKCGPEWSIRIGDAPESFSRVFQDSAREVLK